jgi:fucose permease
MLPPAAPTAPDHAVVGHQRALVAGVVGAIAFGLIGWRGLLVPALLLSVKEAFGRTDAELGAYFLVSSVAYGAGALAGGLLLRRLGSRATVGLAGLAISIGLLAQGSAGSWIVFLVAGASAGLGAGLGEMSINALFLDLFPRSRDRALNLLHLSFSVAALAVPVVAAQLVAGGVPWQAVIAGSGGAWLVMTGALVVATPVVTHVASPGTGAARPSGWLRVVPRVLVLLAVAIGCYVASEVGASDWMIRFLDDLPVTEASLALTMLWGGMAVGRLAFARIGGRFEPVRAAAVAVMVGAAFQAAAVLVPDPRVSILLFGAVGVAFGPVYPLIVSAAGARLPDRTALVTSTLVFGSVVGAVAYSPAMGVISDAAGIGVAMLGTAVLALLAGLVLLAARAEPGDGPRPAPAALG